MSSVADFRPPGPHVSVAAKQPLIRGQDVQELVEPLKNLIVQYPSAALASAFLIGVVVAWWIKRR